MRLRWVPHRYKLGTRERCPWLSEVYEERTESSEAWLHIGTVKLMLIPLPRRKFG